MVNNQKVILDEDGFLQDRTIWDPEVAGALAQRNNILLSEEHWKVIRFLQGYYEHYRIIPPLRIFIKNLAAEYGMELANSIKLHQLFPDSPLKYACMIAGLPKPRHCM